jgi:acyl-CoA synthetase (AMP-forming)/AMP-acid ligase II
MWQEVVAARGDAVAVVETATGAGWSFRDLDDAAAEHARRLTAEPVAFPSGHGPGFVIETLAAWTAGAVVCPLEPGAARPAVPAPDAWPDGIVLAKSTSGTSGTPKLVLFDAPALAADARHIVRTMSLTPALPNVGAISLAHSYGFSSLVLPLLLHGVPLRLAASPLPESVRAAIGAAPSVALPAVPALWTAWESAGLIDHRIALAVSAGAPLPVELEQRVFAATGVKIHNFLGASECGGIAYDRTDTPRSDPTLAGTPLDGVSLSVDPDGLLEVESPAVARAYWPDDPPPPTRLRPGRFRTADLARLGHDGCHLLGRSSDAVNLAGRKCHPAEIESLLHQHPAVRECLVFGIPSPDPGRGEELVACIAPATTTPTDEHSLAAWLTQRLPAWKLPRHWWICENLAPDPRGKFPRAAWRAAFLRHRKF